MRPTPALVAAVAAASASVLLAWTPAGASAEDQQWIVTFAEGAVPADAEMPDGVEVAAVLDEVGAVTLEATPDEVAALLRDEQVGTVEPVRELELALDVVGPALGLPTARAHGFDGHGRQIAVLDSGVDVAHPTFAGAPVSEACFAPSGTTCPGGGATATGPGSSAPPCASTTCFHGTHVAGIAVGRGGGGVAPGVAPGAGLVSVRIFGIRSGRLVADTASLLGGLDHVIGLRQAGAPIDAVNLSLVTGSGLYTGHCDGAGTVSQAVRSAIVQLTALGVVVVAAAGNDGAANGVAEPACFASSLAVGASDMAATERVASFSNSGAGTDLLAPGLDIRSAGSGGGSQRSSGTSAAAPFVAGAVAALRSGAPTLAVPRVRGVLAGAGVLVADPARGAFLRLDVAATVLSLGDGIGVGSGGSLTHLRDSPTPGRPVRSLRFGTSADRLLVGDWNGDGVDTLGLRRGATVILTNNPAGGAGQISFAYGSAGDQVVVGDWDGDGRDSIGIRRGNAYHLRNQLSQGPPQHVFAYGSVSDVAVVGDWDGDGTDSIGLQRGGAFLLRNNLSGGPADVQFAFGRAGDVPVAGDWTDQGRDTVGVRRGNGWFLRTDNAAGPADLAFSFGSSSTPPIVGNWDGT